MSTAPAYSFGPFTLDPSRRILMKGETRLWVQDRQFNVLLALVAGEGRTLTKDDLIRAGWGGAAVTDNGVVQVVVRLRQALSVHPGAEHYIETVARQGYRFVEPVQRAVPPVPHADLAPLLSPFLAFDEGRTALEALTVPDLQRARSMLDGAVRADPRFDGAMTAMATAMLLAFETTRADTKAAAALLLETERLARDACRVNPMSGHAWATLALALHRQGDAREALAAARKAVTLEPDVWLHHLRLAVVSWGDERLRAARRTLTECPGVVYAHWLAATVYVARGRLDRALDEARVGCAQQTTGRMPATGLYWLSGLLLHAIGRDDDALSTLQQELTFEATQHIYAREACANSWYAIGAIHHAHGRRDMAAHAFAETLTRVPGHRRALAALRRESASPALNLDERVADPVEIAIDRAVALARDGRHQEAASVCGKALGHAEAGSAGWLLPIEPMLSAAARPEIWASTLTLLFDRAR